MAARGAGPGATPGLDGGGISPESAIGSMQEDPVVPGDETVELIDHPGFLLAESGAFEGFKELTAMLIVPAAKNFAVDIVPGEISGVLVEDVELAAQSELSGEAAQDVGEKAVEGAEKE